MAVKFDSRAAAGAKEVSMAAAMAIGRKQSVQDKDESHPVDVKPDPWDSPPLHPSSPPAMECSSLPRGFVVRSLTPEKENSALTLDCVNPPKRQMPRHPPSRSIGARDGRRHPYFFFRALRRLA